MKPFDKLYPFFVIMVLTQKGFSQNRFNTSVEIREKSTFLERKNGINEILSSISIPASWSSYLNPQTAEFWTEGNHKPDAGFLLFLKDMTVDSAKLWLLRGEIKARYLEEALVLTEQAQRELVRDGLMKDRYHVVANRAAQLSSTKNSLIKSSKVLNELQLFFIFSPTCPHCQALAKTLVGFPKVNPLQATKGPLHHWQGLNKSELATPQTLAGYAPDGAVPVLVLHHVKRNEAIVLKGALSTEEILQGAAQLLGKNPEGLNGK